MSLHPLDDLRLSVAQRQLLATLPDRLPLQRIDRIWVFPPHAVRARETGLLAISLLPPAQHDTSHRILFTLRYEADAATGRDLSADGPTEEGSAPPDRIERVIGGVLARSGDALGAPVLVAIEGSLERWQALEDEAALNDLTG